MTRRRRPTKPRRRSKCRSERARSRASGGALRRRGRGNRDRASVAGHSLNGGRWIIDTDVDAQTTCGRMAKLCDRAMLDPRVIYASNRVIADAGAAPRDVVAQIEAIAGFMDSSFYFVPNPIGTQTIRPPGWTRSAPPGMLEDIAARGVAQGACDDAAVLVATLGMANGIPARFRAIAFCYVLNGRCDPTESYTHVIADLFDGQQWRELDVTRPYDLERPSNDEIAKTLVYPVT